MENLYKKLIVLLSLLLTFSCAAQSTVQQDQEASPECMRALCENPMAKTFTETAADADFATGPTWSVTGDVGTAWWDVNEAGVQQLADRSQAIRKLVGIADDRTRLVHVPLNTSIQNSSSRFTSGVAGGIYWEQTSVASAGFLQFAVPPLPIGAKITQVKARWGNNFTAALAIGTPPTISLTKSGIATGVSFVSGVGNPTTIGTQADTTAVLATYKLLHDITLTVNETVSADAVYSVSFTGEDGANESTGGVLAGIILTISLP